MRFGNVEVRSFSAGRVRVESDSLMKSGSSWEMMFRPDSTAMRPAAALLFTIILILSSGSALLFSAPATILADEEEIRSAGPRISDGDVDVQVLHVGDRWTYDGFFDVAEMITNSGVETDAEALTGELDMWVDDVLTRETENHSTVMYRIKSVGLFIAENITLSGTLGDITIDYDSTDLVRAGDLATFQTIAHMHVKFWITETSSIDVADVTVTDSYYEPVEVYDFPLRVGEEWTNDFLDVNWWSGNSAFFTIPEDETLAGQTNHSVVSVGDPSVTYSGCGNSYNVSTFDENGSVSAFRWWCPAAKGDAWRHYKDAMGIYVDFLLKDFTPATSAVYMEVDLEYPTWALNLGLGVWVNVTDSSGSPVSGLSFVLRYEFDDLWVELSTDSNGVAYYLMNTSDPTDSTPSNHDYASHGIVAWDPVNEYVGVDTLTLDDELVDLDYRPRPGGISVSRDRGEKTVTLNPVYGFNAIAGDILHFTVPVENKGINGGPATEMEMVAPDGSSQRLVIDALPPVGEQILNFDWTVPADQPSGEVQFTFEVDPDDNMAADVNQTNDLAGFPLFIGTLPVASLAQIPPTLTQTEILLDASGSSDGDGGSLHCTFEVEVDVGDVDTFEEADCQLMLNWSDDGMFHIDLTVTDEERDQDSTSLDLEIVNRLPWVNVTSPESEILAETSITFNAFDSGDADTLDSDAPLTFLWDPPDRSDGVAYECEEGPITMMCTVTPLEEGDFVMQLHGTDDDGATTTGVFILGVGNIAPREVGMTMDGGATENDQPAPSRWVVDEDEEVTLHGSAVDTMNDQDGLNWLWNPSSSRNESWQVDTVGPSSEVGIIWSESGDHIITLEVFDDDGASSGVVAGFVTVNNVPPTTEEIPAQLPVGEDRLFEFTGTYSDTVSDVDGLQVCWDVDLERDSDDNLVKNDDCDYSGATISHSWGVAGVYTIRFHVMDDDGDIAFSEVEITVVNLKPKAAMEPVETTVNVGEEVVIYPTGTSDTASDMSLLLYSWDVDTSVDSDGDGDPANDIDAFTTGDTPLRHKYSSAGVKEVRLTVSDEVLSSSKTVTIMVVGGESSLLGALGETAGISNILIILLVGVIIIATVAMTMRRSPSELDIAGLVTEEELFADESEQEDGFTHDMDGQEPPVGEEE